MLENLFLGLSLMGAEWVLYLLILLSVISVAVMFERARFYRLASRDLEQFRAQIRASALAGRWEEALQAAEKRKSSGKSAESKDLEAELTAALIASRGAKNSPEVLSEVAHDAIVRSRLEWEKNLAILATIGNNAPFVGLFGTVLGIIKAFHDLSRTAGSGAHTVSAGISEALIATAVGIMVAIPAVVAFNLFQRKVKAAINHAEAMKSFLIGRLAD